MIITISGTPGSGKNTIADILAQKLKLKRYSVGDFRREAARKLGLSLEEYNKLGEKKEFTDKEADEWQVKIGKSEDNFIIDGRLSYHFIPNSVKIFLDVSPKVGARRIMLDNRQEEKMADDKEAVKKWKSRMASDIKRYKKYYNIDPYRKEHYDLVHDTSKMTIDQVTQKIIEFVNKK